MATAFPTPGASTAASGERRGLLATIWRTYEGQNRRWRAALPLLLFLAGFAEGVGLTMLLPLFIVLNESPGAGSSTSRAMLSLLAWLHVPPDIMILLALLVAVIAVKAGLLLIVMRHVATIVVGISAEFRRSLVDALMSARWSYFVEQPTGRLASAIGGEADRAANVFLYSASFMADTLQVIVLIGFAFVLSWQLTVAAAAIGLAVVGTLHGLTRLSHAAGRRQTAILWSLTNRLVEGLAWMKPLKASAREFLLRPILENEIDALSQAVRHLVIGQQATIILQEPILVLGVATVLMVAASWFAVPIDTLAAIGILLYRIASRIGAIQRSYILVAGSGSALLLVVDTIDRAREAREVHAGHEPPSLRVGIDVDGVTLRLGSSVVLRDLSVSIKAGTLTVITGASGIGKTSLVDLLCGLYVPDRGEIRVDGVPLARLDLAAWRRRIGYVPQDVVLVNNTVLENVRLNAEEIDTDRVRQVLETACAWEFVAAMPDGLDTIIGERGAKLSGGQRQRLALARALVHDPELLILDEATTGLDAPTAEAVRDRLRERLGPLTIVAISHQPEWTRAADATIDLAQLGAVAEQNAGAPA